MHEPTSLLHLHSFPRWLIYFHSMQCHMRQQFSNLSLGPRHCWNNSSTNLTSAGRYLIDNSNPTNPKLNFFILPRPASPTFFLVLGNSNFIHLCLQAKTLVIFLWVLSLQPRIQQLLSTFFRPLWTKCHHHSGNHFNHQSRGSVLPGSLWSKVC